MKIIPSILKMKMWSRYVKNLMKIHWWNTSITTWIIKSQKKEWKITYFSNLKSSKKIRKDKPQILFFLFFPFSFFFLFFLLSLPSRLVLSSPFFKLAASFSTKTRFLPTLFLLTQWPTLFFSFLVASIAKGGVFKGLPAGCFGSWFASGEGV